MKETFYRIPGLPCRLAMISDLHERPFDAVIRSLQKRRPDIITIAGDLREGISPRGEEPVVLRGNTVPFLKACREIAPVYMSLGNHEWMLSDEDLRILRDTGTVILDNEWITLPGIQLGGLTSSVIPKYRKYREQTGRVYPPADISFRRQRILPDTGWLDEFEKQPGFRILLSHHPEYWEPCLRNRHIDLVLSGHAHGGQIQLFGRGLFAPGQGLFPKYTHGIHEVRLVVSRGLANTAPPFIPRLFNPRELLYLQGEND